MQVLYVDKSSTCVVTLLAATCNALNVGYHRNLSVGHRGGLLIREEL